MFICSMDFLFYFSLNDFARYSTPLTFVNAMKKKGIRIPGIGHRIKSRGFSFSVSQNEFFCY